VGINTNLSVRDANSRYAVIDLARGSVQNITYTNTESEVFLLLTNVAAGQNVTVYFYNGDLTAATSKIFHVPANVLNYAGKLYVYQGVTNQLLDNFLLHGKTAVLNFTAFDSTNVVFSTSIER
jgi:hypothetical protein